MLNDFRYAARMLLKNPSFTAVAVLTLALGIGANTAIFSIVCGVLLRPLPFEDPDRLVLLWGSKPQQGRDQIPFSLPNLADLRDQSKSFESITAWTLGRLNLSRDKPTRAGAVCDCLGQLLPSLRGISNACGVQPKGVKWNQ